MQDVIQFFEKCQTKEGTFELKQFPSLDPTEYQTPVVLTGQATKTLIEISGPIAIINKGLHFLLANELNEAEPLPSYGWKLNALKYSNTELANKEKNKILDILEKKQRKDGSWFSFPYTFSMTNGVILESISDSKRKEMINKSINWFKKNKGKDGKGWGRDHSENSVPTFTAVALISLISAGVDPLEKWLREASQFLKEKQSKDGSWRTSKYTDKRVTSFSISVCALALLLTDPKFSGIEKAENLLLKMKKEGGWPITKNENPTIYTTYFAIHFLKFKEYFQKRISDSDLKPLLKFIPLSRISAYLYREYELYLKQKFLQESVNQILNSKALGSTKKAIKRRIDILKILSKKGELDIAAIIDELKKKSEYSYLNKKYHITQIKSDLDHLKNLKIVDKIHDLYFATVIPLL